MNLFDNKQKAYIESPLNYTGSKYKLLDQIIPHFSKRKRFVDSFCGGGSVFINSDYEQVLANDKIESLIEFYRELSSKSWESIEKEIETRKTDKNSQEEYLELRSRYNDHKNPYDFFLLVCSCTNNMLRFNKAFQFNQTWGKRTYNNNTREKLYRYWEVLYGSNRVVFSNKDFYDFPVSKDDFVYLDPPYLISEAGYNAFWSNSLEDKLYDYIDYLDSEKIKFALSNVKLHKGIENPYMNRLVKYKILDLQHNYGKVSRTDEKTETIEMLVVN